MKRMKKKVVAMVTLAMFMMTLLPMAAFAAADTPTGDGYPEYSKLTALDVDVTTAADDYARIEASVLKADGVTAGTVAPVRIWVENENGDNVRGFQFSFDKGNNWEAAPFSPSSSNGGALTDGQEFWVKCTVPGKYTVHAGQVLAQPDGTEKMVEFAPTEVINVTGEETTVSKVEITNPTNGNMNYANGEKPNGTVFEDVTVKLTEKDGTVCGNKVVTIDNNNSGITVVKPGTTDEVTEVTTNNKGEAKVQVVADTGVSTGTYSIFFDCEGEYDELKVVINGGEDNKPVSIERVDTDSKTVNANDVSTLKDVVQFAIKSANGEQLDINDFNEKAEIGGDANNVKTLVEPKGSNVEFKIVDIADTKNVGLGVTNNVTSLKEGDYTVRVALNDGDSVDVTFTVAKFKEAVEMKFNMNSDIKNDSVVLNKQYENNAVVWVDENGVEKPATGIVLGGNGDALIKGNATDTDFRNSSNFKFKTVNETDKSEKEALYGTKITLTAVDSKNGFTITKELTVIDEDNLEAKALAYDKTSGEAGKTNKVTVSIVDANGDKVKDGNIYEVTAYVEKKSVEDARVKASIVKNTGDNDATLTLSSDVECTADIRVAVKVKGGVMYVDTLSYTFGKQDIPAETSVVMTLGSTEMLINNNIVDMKDAAPFAQDNRTYVPFRALGEALGAKVEYDQDAKTVTYNLGNTEIVMTLDSKTYTVNGAEKTMDVAPFAKDNRTYVPVRFVGEALGFTVTGLTNGAGQYVAVAFTK